MLKDHHKKLMKQIATSSISSVMKIIFGILMLITVSRGHKDYNKVKNNFILELIKLVCY